jgi:hypothetical protein
MKPFSVKYVQPRKKQNREELPSAWYDTCAESMVFLRSGKAVLVIDDPAVSLNTGTLMTFNSTDSTTDEQTDR